MSFPPPEIFTYIFEIARMAGPARGQWVWTPDVPTSPTTPPPEQQQQQQEEQPNPSNQQPRNPSPARSRPATSPASLVLSEPNTNSETRTRRGKRSIYRDYNHPGNLVHLHSLQWFYCKNDEDIKNRVSECTQIFTALVPMDVEKHRKVFYYNYREWWAIFKYSKSDVIRGMKRQMEKLINAEAAEEQAALVSRLNNELNKISEKRTVYEKQVVVNESDVESVVGALVEWGLEEDRLLKVVRIVHSVWEGDYSTENVTWPRQDPNENNTTISP